MLALQTMSVPAIGYCKGAEYVQVKSSIAVKKRVCDLHIRKSEPTHWGSDCDPDIVATQPLATAGLQTPPQERGCGGIVSPSGYIRCTENLTASDSQEQAAGQLPGTARARCAADKTDRPCSGVLWREHGQRPAVDGCPLDYVSRRMAWCCSEVTATYPPRGSLLAAQRFGRCMLVPWDSHCDDEWQPPEGPLTLASYQVRRRPSLPRLEPLTAAEKSGMGNRLDKDEPPSAAGNVASSCAGSTEAASVPHQENVCPVAATALVNFPPPPSSPPSDDDRSCTGDVGDDVAASSSSLSENAEECSQSYTTCKSCLSLCSPGPHEESEVACAGLPQADSCCEAAPPAAHPVTDAASTQGSDGNSRHIPHTSPSVPDTAADACASSRSKAGVACADAARAATTPRSVHQDSGSRLARMRLTLDLSDCRLPWEAHNPARRLAQLLPVTSEVSNFEEVRFASLPYNKKSMSSKRRPPLLSSGAPPPEHHCYLTQEHTLGVPGASMHECSELPRSPTLLDELHGRYYGIRRQQATTATSTATGCDVIDQTSSQLVPTILLPSPVCSPVTFSESPFASVEHACESAMEQRSEALYEGTKPHISMFGDVGKMFGVHPSTSASDAVLCWRSQPDGGAPPCKVDGSKPKEDVVKLLADQPLKYLAPPPMTILRVCSADGSSTDSSSTVPGRNRVAKLSRAFSLSPQILRRKHRAVTDSQPGVAIVPSSTNKDKDEHGGSLPLPWGRKKTQETEVSEACGWLSEAGFPQYLQMFEEGHFPLELSSVEKDHAFLEARLLQSLFRRLAVLNRCAHMKLELTNRKLLELHADDDQQCALSDKWRVNHKTGRWLHVEDMTRGSEAFAGSLDNRSVSSAAASQLPDVCGEAMSTATADHGPLLQDTSSRHKANAIARPGTLLRSISDTLRSSRRARRSPLSPSDNNSSGPLEISVPVLIASAETDAQLQRLGCVDIGRTVRGSPRHCGRSFSPSDALNNNTDHLPKSKSAGWLLRMAEDEEKSCGGASATYLLPSDYVPGTFPRALSKAASMPLNDRADPTAAGDSARSSSDCAGRIGRSVSLRQQRTLQGNSAWTVNRHSIYDNVPSSLVGCSEEVTQLELALRELLELNSPDCGESLSPPAPLSSAADEYGCGSTPDLLPEPCASTPDSSPPAQQAGRRVRHAATVENRNDMGIEPDIVSASGSSNHEVTSDQDGHGSKEDLSEVAWQRERRDSGVGSSLTREPSEGKKKPRLRWHSFVKSHRPSMSSENQHVSCLPAGQLLVLQKLCRLYISSVMDEHCSQVTSSQHAGMMHFPKFVKRVKSPDYTHKNVFGVPLSVVQQRSGQPLPQCILYAMRYLRKTAVDSVGIFRKSGVKSRIEKLHDDLEENPDVTDFEGLQAYDVADLLKKYFRELPECLLTNKMSQTFLAIQQCVPGSSRLEVMQACTVLLPCENREALEALLCFLSDMADHSKENQMTASNLAVCFAPSLFDVCGRRPAVVDSKSIGRTASATNKMAMPDQKELLDQKLAHECLTLMITNCKSLFKVPEDFLAQCHCSYMEAADPVPLAMLGPDYRSHVESCIQGLLKESHEGFKGWDKCQSNEPDIELSCKKVGDGNPLRLWKASVEVEAPPVEVLDRVLHERHLWDEDLAKWRTVEKLDANTEVFHYACSFMPPQPQRDYVELRSWRTELPNGSCVLVSHSIDCPAAAQPGSGVVRGVVLASSYLVEPCGTGRSRVTHVSRVDVRGRPPDWYSRNYGQLEANCLLRLRDTFRRHHAAVVAQPSDVPETSV